MSTVTPAPLGSPSDVYDERRFPSVLSILTALIFALLVIVPASPALADSGVASAGSSRDTIVARAQAWGVLTSQDDVRYSGESPDASSLSHANGILNLYRFIAGVSDVGFDGGHNRQAQAATKALSKMGGISHSLTDRPAGLTDAEWADAQAGASKSNLGSGYRNFMAMSSGMMADSGPSNISVVGHRRWMTSPRLVASGAGMTGSVSALYVVDVDHGRSFGAPVAWPATQTPVQLWEDGSPWSLSFDSDPNIGTVHVTMRRVSDGATWDISGSSGRGRLWCDTQDFGDGGAVIWSPSDLTVSEGDAFDVTVTGTPVGTVSYRVEFFSLGSGFGGTGSGNGGGWEPADGIIVDVDGNTPVRRLYNRWSGEHHYVTDANEYFSLVRAGWNYEGIPWMAPPEGPEVYRLYNKWSGEHLYTTSSNERDQLCALGWNYEGVAWHSDADEGEPVYRAYNPYGTGVTAHLYTTDRNEVDTLCARGYIDEGVAWYGVAE